MKTTIIKLGEITPYGEQDGDRLLVSRKNGTYLGYTWCINGWSHDGKGDYRKQTDGEIVPVPGLIRMGGYTKSEYTKWLSREGFAV